MADNGGLLPFVGTWDSATLYQRGDCVLRSGVLYQARTNRDDRRDPTAGAAFWDDMSAVVATYVGTADPTSGGGIPAAVGSTYQRAGTGLYIKSDTAATDWTAAGAGGGGGFTPVGCVIEPTGSIDAVAANPAYFVWDGGILDNPYDGNAIEALPDGIGIDPASLATDTLVTTEAGVWAFTADAITIANDATWEGYVTFGNMGISVVIDVRVRASGGGRLISPSAIYNLSAGAGFSVGIAGATPATAPSLACSISGLVIVRLA